GGKPGDAATIRSAWQWSRNTRDLSGNLVQYVLALNKDVDQQLDRRELTAFDLEIDGYPRPVKGSSLAANGYGVTDPSFPRYVGALPPEGTEPWDWDRTVPAWLKQPGGKP